MVPENAETFSTLVLGASCKAGRFSYLAIKSLVKHGVRVYAIGSRPCFIDGVQVHAEKINLTNLHTVTLYLNSQNQTTYYDYILSLKPKRIIFNPGAENPELVRLAHENRIDYVFGCTLVMLNDGSFFKS